MLVNRNGELETDGNVAVIQEYTLKHDIAGFTYDNGPYFVMERYDDRLHHFSAMSNRSNGQVLSSTVFLVPFLNPLLALLDLGLGPAYWVLAFVCLISSFYFILFFFVFAYVC